ncbi:MAG: TIGR04442 family protein, partial [Nitrospira sp.]|nr:TIGR04442 family protein [Nitrospira sp.]
MDHQSPVINGYSMIQDIRLHGHVTDTIEYFATVAGQNISHRFFYETDSPNEDVIIRFFAPGSEFIIGKEAITYKGNGGGFCEYMFGINQPLKDMIKKEVVNRLVMYGAIYEPNLDHIYFTNQTAGSET